MRLRKIAVGLAAALAVVLVALVTLPYLFRDRLAARLRAEIDGAVNARVAWADVGLDVFRDFPDVTLRIDRPSVVNVAPFIGDTLVSMDRATVVLDVASVWRHLTSGGRIVVRDVALERPAVKLTVLPDGRASWDIAKPRAARDSAAGRAVGVTLRGLRITDGRMTLDDRASRLVASVHGLREELRGDFARERFVLATRTRADSVSLRFAGVPYLSRVDVELNADVDADLKARRFTFDRDTLRLNALRLAFGGRVTAGDPDLALDVTFSTPGTDFKDILSLVPAVYAREFAQVRTTGTMAVRGSVRGTYGPNAFPALALRATVQDGTFRYPSLPLGARDIHLDLAVDNPGGHVDRTVVTLERLRAAVGGRPFEARFVLRTPVSDPDVDLRARGAVDLADVARTVKLDGAAELTGMLAADVAVRARLSDVDARRYAQVDASGTVHVGRLSMRTAALPDRVLVDTAALRLTPRAAELSTLAARIGATDVRASGALDNLLGFVLRGDELRGTGTVRSERLDLKALVPAERTDGVLPVPANVDFTLNASADRVTFGDVVAERVRGGLRVKDRRVTLDTLRMQMLKGTVLATGFYDTRNVDRPTFDADLRLGAVDVAAAYAVLATVQKLAPIARFAQGTVSGGVRLAGPMDRDMAPVVAALTGAGEITSERLALQGVPALGKLADLLSLEQVRNPAVGAVRADFAVADGRVTVRPFATTLGALELTVGGSHGIDQTLQYDLGLAVPRALVAGAARGALVRLASRAGTSAAAVDTAGAVQLRAAVTGTIADPRVDVGFAGLAATAREAAKDAIAKQVAARADVVRERVDSAAESARRRARAEAERALAEAERQGARLRAEARTLAASIRQTGAARADSLEARATSPVARIAARQAAERLRSESAGQAERVVREADAKADALVAKAREQADAVAPPKP